MVPLRFVVGSEAVGSAGGAVVQSARNRVVVWENANRF